MKYLMKLFICLFILLGSYSTVSAQLNKKKGPDIYIGFSGGINFTQAKPLNQFGILNSLTETENDFFTKDYKPLLFNLGNQFNFMFWYPVKEVLHLGISPGMATYNYTYVTTTSWNDEANNDVTRLTNTHHQKLRYLEIPITVRYLIRFHSMSPYLQVGGSYGRLYAAQKQSSGDLVLETTSGEFPINTQSNSGDVQDAYIGTKLTLFGGVGVAMDLKYVVLTLDANYHHGLNNVVNESNRYSDNTFSGATYDVQDDIKLKHVVINLGLLFPINQIKKRGALDCIYFNDRRPK